MPSRPRVALTTLALLCATTVAACSGSSTDPNDTSTEADGVEYSRSGPDASADRETGTGPPIGDPDVGLPNDGDTRDGGPRGADTSSAPDTAARDTGANDTGRDDDTGPPSDSGSPGDTGTTTDTASSGDTAPVDTGSAEDAGTDTAPGCGGRCGANATCSGGTCQCKSGYDGDPTSTCYQPKSCSSRSDCGSFTLCVGGSCKCEPGFVRTGAASCARPSVGSPGSRSKSAVCDRWTSRTTNFTTNLWANSPANTCSTGTLKQRVQWEALEQTNVYRWLLGLDPLHADQTYIDKNQQCATVLAAEGTLTHNIQSSFQCYTQDAADGASSSNLAYGRSHPAPTVRQYIEDSGTPKLGHRRWIFSPTVGATGFGHRGRYGCMWTIDGSGTDSQNDMFYPAPGPFPAAALHGPWSYLSAARISTSNAQIKVVDTNSGSNMSVQNVNRLTNGAYGRVTGVSWEVPNASSGNTYRVTISNLENGASKSYTTTLVTCP